MSKLEKRLKLFVRAGYFAMGTVWIAVLCHTYFYYDPIVSAYENAASSVLLLVVAGFYALRFPGLRELSRIVNSGSDDLDSKFIIDRDNTKYIAMTSRHFGGDGLGYVVLAVAACVTAFGFYVWSRTGSTMYPNGIGGTLQHLFVTTIGVLYIQVGIQACSLWWHGRRIRKIIVAELAGE